MIICQIKKRYISISRACAVVLEETEEGGVFGWVGMFLYRERDSYGGGTVWGRRREEGRTADSEQIHHSMFLGFLSSQWP